jgi:L-alanine-DL-glutamate epimerase-like enolase superfamily enzyme
VTTSLLSVPTGNLISDSIHSLDNVEVVICTVGTNDGTKGLGYTYTVGTGGYAIKAIIDTVYGKRLAGKDPSETASLWREMCESTHAMSRGGITAHAMAAVDIALWDTKGKEASRPLYWLLGGGRRPIPLYDADGGWPRYSTEELVRAAKAVARRGFHGFKIKVEKSDGGGRRESQGCKRSIE